MTERPTGGSPEQAKGNPDRELWRDERGMVRVFITDGDGLGIDVGGFVIVRPVADWHQIGRVSSSALREAPPTDILATALCATVPHYTSPPGLTNEPQPCQMCRETATGLIDGTLRVIRTATFAAGAALREAAPTPGNLEEVAREVHASWRDGMLQENRPVAQERMAWETLSEIDRELDRYIAARVCRLLLGARAGVRDRD